MRPSVTEHMIGAALMAAFWQQIAFFGHDIGHNVHHVVCNSIENDPDIQHMPIFAVTPEIFGKWWSTYHQKTVITDDAARFLVSFQHYLYYPVMAVARFNLYIQSYLLLLSREKVDHKALEIGTLLVFAGWFPSM